MNIWTEIFSLALTALVCSLLFASGLVSAAETTTCVNLEGNTPSIDTLKKSISYYEDQSANRSLRELPSDNSIAWSQLNETIPSFGFTNSAFWLRLQICPARKQHQDAVLEITYPLLDNIHIFGLVEHSLVYDVISGDDLPFSQRPVQHRNFVFFLPDLEKGLSLYIRVQTSSAMQIPLRLEAADDFFQHNQQALLLQGLYFGIILAMVLYNAFLFFVLRERPYLLYVLFTASFASFQGVYQGFFQQFFFNCVWLQNHSLPIFGFISIFFANLFSISFLNLSANNNRISRILRVIGWVASVAAMLAAFFPTEIMVELMLALAVPSSIFIMIAGCRLWWNGHMPARIFTIAWSTLLVSFVLSSFNKFSLIPRVFWTENILQIGSLIEVILLSIALAERVSEEKRQRILAERRLSTSLEEKVQERTLELNKALEQLERANTELSQMSQTDSLTQIANRRSFDLQLALEYKSATRTGCPLVLVMIDIDHFKQFNDTYGHQVGDKVLRSVAKILKAQAVRPGDSIYRYGGEEFAVLLNNTDLAGAEIVAEKMRKSIEMTPVIIHGRSFFVTISAGLGLYSPRTKNGPVSSPEDLIHQADLQLYKAKEKGRNCLELEKYAQGG